MSQTFIHKFHCCKRESSRPSKSYKINSFSHLIDNNFSVLHNFWCRRNKKKIKNLCRCRWRLFRVLYEEMGIWERNRNWMQLDMLDLERSLVKSWAIPCWCKNDGAVIQIYEVIRDERQRTLQCRLNPQEKKKMSRWWWWVRPR